MLGTKRDGVSYYWRVGEALSGMRGGFEASVQVTAAG